jgi:hypothetical protein
MTVKKNDGTTDVVYTLATPSSGDNTPAIWRNNTVGTAVAFRPEFRLLSKNNGPRTARRVEAQFVWPTTVTGSDGRVSVSDRLPISISAAVPNGMVDTEIAEAISQGMNLLVQTLVKDSFKSGFAPS